MNFQVAKTCFGKNLRKIAAPLLVVFSPVSAEPWIDYNLVLSEHKDQVRSEIDREGSLIETLEMPTGVQVRCVDRDKGGSCESYDRSEDGAAGCTVLFLFDVHTRVIACPDLATDDERKRIEAMLADLSFFVAENSVPPRSPGDVIEMVRNMVVPIHARADQCLNPGFREETVRAISVMTSQESFDRLADYLTTPRLPVLNPCF